MNSWNLRNLRSLSEPSSPVSQHGVLPVVVLAVTGSVFAGDPVALRVENFTVPPATQPLAFVVIENLEKLPYKGRLSLKGPEGWRIAPAARDVSLAPGEVQRVPFTIERGTNQESNRYPVDVSAIGGGATVDHKQDVVCASAPYFKPTVDGETKEWRDAIPITFTTRGKTTVVSTYWNRRQFSLLVIVEEDELIGLSSSGGARSLDAVQFALSPEDSRTGTSRDDDADRYEFLIVSAGSGTGKCFQLAEPGSKLAEAARHRSLAGLEYGEAKVAVARKGRKTIYECSVPFRPIRERIRPGEGREFFLSVLVHDPGGTGIRDLGEAAGLWPEQRTRLAWSSWEGVKWGRQPPFDNKCRWGLCASKY